MTIPIQQRLQECQANVQDFYAQMSNNASEIQVVLEAKTPIASGNMGKKILYINPLLLLNLNDLPESLRNYDPEKIDDSFFNKLNLWISSQVPLSQEKNSILTFYLHLWKNPELAKKAKHFSLAHEAAHIYLKHQPTQWEIFLTILIVIAFCGLMGGIVLSAFLVFHIVHRLLHLLRLYSYQYQEKEADLKALEATHELQGAKYLLNLFHEYREREWKKLSPFKKLDQFFCNTEKYFSISHPSPLSRIRYLEEKA